MAKLVSIYIPVCMYIFNQRRYIYLPLLHPRDIARYVEIEFSGDSNFRGLKLLYGRFHAHVSTRVEIRILLLRQGVSAHLKPLVNIFLPMSRISRIYIWLFFYHPASACIEQFRVMKCPCSTLRKYNWKETTHSC